MLTASDRFQIRESLLITCSCEVLRSLNRYVSPHASTANTSDAFSVFPNRSTWQETLPFVADTRLCDARANRPHRCSAGIPADVMPSNTRVAQAQKHRFPFPGSGVMHHVLSASRDGHRSMHRYPDGSKVGNPLPCNTTNRMLQPAPRIPSG